MKYLNLYQKYYYQKNNIKPSKSLGFRTLPLLAMGLVIVLTFAIVKIETYSNIGVQKNDNNAAVFSNNDIVVGTVTYEEALVAQNRLHVFLDNKNKQDKELEYQELVRELNANFQIGDWIKITWWGNIEDGPNAPSDASCTGQIKHITNGKVYGTWGNYPLKYGTAAFQRIRKSEYLELREKEQRQRDRKARQNKYKSWGRIPGSYSN